MPETVTKTKATESPVSVADTSDASHMAASDERAALERDLMSTWRDLFGLLQSQAAPKWANLDVSMAQIKTLITLSDVRTATIGEIAAKLGIGLPTASHLVEKLVQLGLVERAEDPEDRRRAIARLTAKGDELVRQLRGSQHLGAWIPLLADDDLAALVRGLHALARAICATTAPKTGGEAAKSGATTTSEVPNTM